MATGWNKVDQEAAEVITDLEEGDILETDLVQKLHVQNVEWMDRTIGSDDYEVLWVDGESNYGGRHAFVYWPDPKVTDSEGNVRDWDHAVLTKRWRPGDGRWMNNSDNLTELEVVGHLDMYSVGVTVYGGGNVPKDEYDKDEARDVVAGRLDAGGFNKVLDANEELNVQDDGDKWAVSISASTNLSIRAESFEEAYERAMDEMPRAGDFHSHHIDYITNDRTGEEMNSVTEDDFE